MLNLNEWNSILFTLFQNEKVVWCQRCWILTWLQNWVHCQTMHQWQRFIHIHIIIISFIQRTTTDNCLLLCNVDFICSELNIVVALCSDAFWLTTFFRSQICSSLSLSTLIGATTALVGSWKSTCAVTTKNCTLTWIAWCRFARKFTTPAQHHFILRLASIQVRSFCPRRAKVAQLRKPPTWKARR